MKKRIIFLISIFLINLEAYVLHLRPGWQLEGALSDINISDFNNANIVAVWAWDKDWGKWKVYLPNVNINLTDYGMKI
jgi:hypothetical protein